MTVKSPFTPAAIALIREAFARRPDKIRDLALFELGISVALRASDLVRLTVRDVTFNGAVRDRITIKQTKTATPVTVALSERARVALAALITCDCISGDTPLFRREDQRGASVEAITPKTLRLLVKVWGCDWAGLDPLAISSHSLRKTRPAAMYAQNKDIAQVQRLLGHSSPANTAKYLGISEEDAVNAALAFDL